MEGQMDEERGQQAHTLRTSLLSFLLSLKLSFTLCLSIYPGNLSPNCIARAAVAIS